MTIKDLEYVLNRDVGKYAVIFAFPGIGTGKTHSQLSGCTLENRDMSEIATNYSKLGISFIGISTHSLPPKSDHIDYIKIRKDIDFFNYTNIDGENFVDRFTIFVSNGKILTMRILDTNEHGSIVRNWLGDTIYKILGIPDNDIGMRSALANITNLECGADSLAILELKAKQKTILKIGHRKIIRNEIQHIKDTNVITNLYPKILSSGNFESYSWYHMPKISYKQNTKDKIFKNGILVPSWINEIERVLYKIKNVYHNTVLAKKTSFSKYHYIERIPNLFNNKDFQNVYASCNTSKSNLQTFLNYKIILNGTKIDSMTTILTKIKAKQQLLTNCPYICKIHGDLHLENILFDGFNYYLIDPRLQWDNQPIEEFGYGDPIYDMSTLLHSISCMTNILDLATNDSISSYVKYHIEDDTIKILLDDSIMNNTINANKHFERIIKNNIPSVFLSDNYMTRLHFGVANALFGWLKYGGIVSKKEIWITIYGLALYYMQLGHKHE